MESSKSRADVPTQGEQVTTRTHQEQCHLIEDVLQMLSGGDEDHNEDNWPHDMRNHLAGEAQV
ncbi:hypothetical protein H8959_012852 [Pygathrix nigripes]